MRLTTVAVCAALALAGMARAAAAETTAWKCEFKGTYTEKGQDGATKFTWSVNWTEPDNGDDKISGKEVDEDGSAADTAGSCDDKTCTVTSTYTSGEHKGSTFYWKGAYTDTETKTEDVYVTNFKGTWGPSANDRTSGGTWTAKANCTRK